MRLKQKKIRKSTLSDKIADALTLKPKADIEDDQIFGTKPQTVSRKDFSSSDSEDDAIISDFRKRNVNLLSDINKKYEGKVISRDNIKEKESDSGSSVSDSGDENFLSLDIKNGKQQLSDHSEDSVSEGDIKKKILSEEAYNSDAFESDSDGESDDYSITKLKKVSDNDSDEESNDEEEEGEGYDISQMEEPVKEEFEHVKKQNVSEEAKKGACVRNQLLLWEGLLEMRIHLQRCMNTANQMPMPDNYQEYKKHDEFLEGCNVTKANVASILEKMLSLQSMLLKNNSETKTLSKKQIEDNQDRQAKEGSDEEIPSDTDNEEIPSDTDSEEEKKEVEPSKTPIAKKRKLHDYEKEISTTHKAFKTFRDATIQKWNEKTRLATAANIKTAPTNTILQQISYILSDKEKLRRRTQLKRSEYDIVGYKKTVDETIDQNGSDIAPRMNSRKDNDEYISEIFDDSDFYHQLLRELIECKSADISDPVQLSRQWIALQQMRSKMKRKVDTKATKGRKIKYVVHNQLVNYMAPEKCTTWNDESTKELYSSLFGKMFEQNNVGMNGNLNDNFKIKN